MIWFHTTIGVVALASGLLVMLREKATRVHKTTGWAYVGSMYLLCATSFAIDASSPFFRGLGMFHVMATVSALTVTAGLVPVLRRRSRDWFESHLVYMLWSYVGLIMALDSHFMNAAYRALRPALGSQALTWLVLIAAGWVLPFVVGLILIPSAAQRYRRAFAVAIVSRDEPPQPARGDA